MHLKNVSLSFGTQTIFDDVSIYIPTNSKVGVVGVNGAGKSTLFNLLMKKLDPEAGKINYENEDRISFLPQVITATLTDKDITVYDYLESARPIKELESCLQKTYTRISTHPKEEQKLYQQIIKIERELSYWEQYSADNTLLEIITGLNIDGDMLNQKMLELSGGQK
jgi:ATP-binding cassette subfamily F protein 3